MENDLEEKSYIPNQVISKDSLKTYFENGDIPDEQDFWEWQDSYWHKNDPNDIIPSERLDLSGKADKNATNLDGENVKNWMTKLNIENINQDNIPVVHTFTLSDIGSTGEENEEMLNQLISDFINSSGITIGEEEIHFFQLVDENIQDSDYGQKQYVDNFDSYSTRETKTGGTWIDGKPIYRKTFKKSEELPYLEIPLDQFDKVIDDNIWVTFLQSSNSSPVRKRPIAPEIGEMVAYSDWMGVYYSDSLLKISGPGGNEILDIEVTLEYTKTND